MRQAGAGLAWVRPFRMVAGAPGGISSRFALNARLRVCLRVASLLGCASLTACGTPSFLPTSPTATPVPNAVLLRASGDGTYTTGEFESPSRGWRLDYGYACGSVRRDEPRVFSVAVGDANHPDAYPYPLAVGSAQPHGRDVRGPFQVGRWFLHVSTYGNRCTWHLAVRAG